MGPNSSINYDNDNDDNVDYTASNTNSTGKMVVNGLLVVNEDIKVQGSTTVSNILNSDNSSLISAKNGSSVPIYTGDVKGDLTGNVTGDVTGNVIGNVTGNVTGNVNGNVTGNLTTTYIYNSDGSSLISGGSQEYSAEFVGNLSGNADTATQIASITNSDIVQLTSNQTLTNKTLTSPTITGTGDIEGTFTGNLTGDVKGDVTGNVNGNVTGNLTTTYIYNSDGSSLISGGNIVEEISAEFVGNLSGNADTATQIASITNSDIVQLTTTQTLTNKTLTSPTITGTGDIEGTFTGNLTGNADTATQISGINNNDIVQLTTTQTLTNKTLTSPTITGTGDIEGTFTGNLTGNSDTATQISGINNNDIVQLTTTQTLTNKTLTSPTITGTGDIEGTFTGNLTGNADTATIASQINSSTPTSNSDTGIQGQIVIGNDGDNNYYLYVCVAENTWRRVSLDTFFNLK